MALDKADITQTSTVGSGRWDKAGSLQEQIKDAKPRDTANQVLKQNERNALEKANSPAQNQNGPGPNNTVRQSTEEDRVSMSADVSDLTYVSRQAESPINKGPNEMVLEKKIEEKPGPMRQVYEDRENPYDKAEQMDKILSGPTPSNMSLAEESKSSMFGGYSQDVKKVAEVDQDHPANMGSPDARIESIMKERPESEAGAVESEIGQTLDKLI